MKLGQIATIFIGSCVGAMIIASGAVMVANRNHGIFFDESFGFLNTISVNDFISPAAGIFAAIGCLYTMWLMKYVKGHSLQQVLIAFIPLLIFSGIPLLFGIYVRNVYSNTEYEHLETFTSGLMFFYQGGFIFGLSLSLYDRAHKPVSQ